MGLKYFVFILAIAGLIPLTFLLMVSTRCMKACVFLLPVCFWKYQSTAINFLSNPDFKGTALGFEISIIHLLAIALLAAMFLRQWPLKFFPPGSGLYILYFFICFFSISTSPNKLYSCFELFKMFMSFITFLAVTNYLYMTHDFDSFLNGLATLIIINFLTSLEMKYLLGIWQVRGIFLHQNSMAMFMCLTGPVFFARVLNNEKESIFKNLFYLSIFLMAFLNTLFTYSRGAIVCFPLGCAITLLLSIIFHHTPKTFIILCITGILGIAAASYSLPTIMKRFNSAPSNSALTRELLAKTAMNIIKDKPLLGCGLNTWGIVAKSLYYNPYQKIFTFHANEFMCLVETTYLLVGAECGLLGLGSMLCWFFYYLFQAVYQSFRWRKTDYLYLLVGLAGGLSSNYFQSTLEWVLKQQINFCMLFWCFAIIAALVQGVREHTFLSKLEYIAERKKMLKQRHSEASAPVHQPTHS